MLIQFVLPLRQVNPNSIQQFNELSGFTFFCKRLFSYWPERTFIELDATSPDLYVDCGWQGEKQAPGIGFFNSISQLLCLVRAGKTVI